MSIRKSPLWSNPLPFEKVFITTFGPDSFGHRRAHSYHTGIDLYCPVGASVYPVEAGVIVAIETFTGPEAESPWYNPTKALLVEGDSGVVLYGEIEPRCDLKVGNRVKRGENIGTVVPVLKKDKGNGVSMLHLEAYKTGTRASVWWHHNEEKPACLVDPSSKLHDALAKVKRFQNCSWYEKLWRMRWYLLVPWQACSIMLSKTSMPGKPHHIIPNDDLTWKQAWGLAIGLAQGSMEYYYFWQETSVDLYNDEDIFIR